MQLKLSVISARIFYFYYINKYNYNYFIDNFINNYNNNN
jgi:hypothetical protein